MKAKLLVIRGKPEGLEIPIKSRLTIGRAEDCDVRPATQFVSRHHAVLTFLEGKVWVRDMASRGGTFVNDDRLMPDHPVPLKNGDELRIGPVEFRVLVGAAMRSTRPKAAESAIPPAPHRPPSEEDVSAWLIGDETSSAPTRPEDIDPGLTHLHAGIAEAPSDQAGPEGRHHRNKAQGSDPKGRPSP